MVSKIRIGHGEISVHSPIRTPGIANQKALLAVVVSHRHHRVSADLLFDIGIRHRHDPRSSHLVGFEALVHGKTEHERIAFGQTSFHLPQVLRDPVIRDHLVLQRVDIRLVRRLLSHNIQIGAVRPLVLRANSLLHDRLDSIADASAAVLIHSAFPYAFVVVNEQP